MAADGAGLEVEGAGEVAAKGSKGAKVTGLDFVLFAEYRAILPGVRGGGALRHRGMREESKADRDVGVPGGRQVGNDLAYTF